MEQENIIHEPKRELLHVTPMPLPSNEFLPRLQKIINTNNVFKIMDQLNFHNSGANKSIHTHTHTHTLPIIQKFMVEYKLWDEFRNNFPKNSRYTLGAKIDLLFLDTLEALFTASYLSKQEKLPYLRRASVKLDSLKFFLQIAWEIKALDNKKYEALSKELYETGRMLGGWMRNVEKETPPFPGKSRERRK